jgi:hypothetical protein
MSIDWFLNSSYAKRYVKCVLLGMPIIFAMTYLPPKLSGETVKEYAKSHPQSASDRIGFAIAFSLIIAAPLATQRNSDVSKKQIYKN